METFSTSLAVCVGNSPVISEFPAKRPMTQSFDVFFDLRLNKRLSKQSWGWWFDMSWSILQCHCNVIMLYALFYLSHCLHICIILPFSLPPYMHYSTFLTASMFYLSHCPHIPNVLPFLLPPYVQGSVFPASRWYAIKPHCFTLCCVPQNWKYHCIYNSNQKDKFPEIIKSIPV